MENTYFLVGGAGFIGSHFVDALLEDSNTQRVTIFDNFSSGQTWHFEHHSDDPRFSVINKDIKAENHLCEAMQNHQTVMHFASNADIARAITEPSIDFTEGIYLTFRVLEAARHCRVKRIIYTSGSGVYGDLGLTEAIEHESPLLPISTYGASKLAGEAFISSYCHMFGLSACIFRFGNVVGPRQTHGVAYDFIKRLKINTNQLTILGNGKQSKSYIHIEDVISAVLLAHRQLSKPFEIYNVATTDYLTVNEIADITIQSMGIKNPVTYMHSGEDRGWKGDIPIVRLNTKKIRSLGWSNVKNSRQAVQAAVLSLLNRGVD